MPGRRRWDFYIVIGNVNSDVDETGHINPTAPADQLHNLANDLEQKTNMGCEHPERAAAMRSRLNTLVPPPAAPGSGSPRPRRRCDPVNACAADGCVVNRLGNPTPLF